MKLPTTMYTCTHNSNCVMINAYAQAINFSITLTQYLEVCNLLHNVRPF